MQYASILENENTDALESKKYERKNNKKKEKININKINTILDSIHKNEPNNSSSDSDEEEVNIKNPIRKRKHDIEQFTNYNKNNQYNSVLLESSPYSLNIGTQQQTNYHEPIPIQQQNQNNSELDKLNYIIHLLEELKDEKTGHVLEEVVMYSFLGIFIIFIVDSFSKMGKYRR